MSNETPDQPQRNSGPTIIQAFIWGFVAAAFGALFAFIGSLLSEKPVLPPDADALHGVSTPAEMNRVVDALLTAGQTAIDHDAALVSKFGIGIILLCVLVVASTVYLIFRRRKTQRMPAPAWRTVLLIAIIAVPPIVLTVAAGAMEDRLFQTSSISSALRNNNTRPPVVRKGEEVTVIIPTTLQSFFSYHESQTLMVKRAIATYPSGEQVPVVFSDAHLNDGGRKPGKTDFIPVMENVRLRLQLSVPDDHNLSGAVIDLAVAGSLRLIPSGSKQPTARGDFDTTTRFRVARDKEADFQASYDSLSSRLTHYNWFSFSAAAFAILSLVFLSPWFCRECRGKVSHFKIMAGHLCPTCFEKQKKADAN